MVVMVEAQLQQWLGKGWSGSPRRFYFPGDAYGKGFGHGLEKLEDISRLKRTEWLVEGGYVKTKME